MDLRKYATGFIKPDHVRDGPLLDRIINVFLSEKTQRPTLELASGNQFTVNNTNCAILNKAWGWRSEDWMNQDLELALGHYHDWKEPVETSSHQPTTAAPERSRRRGRRRPPISMMRFLLTEGARAREAAHKRLSRPHHCLLLLVCVNVRSFVPSPAPSARRARQRPLRNTGRCR